MTAFPAAVHHVALTVTDLESSRAWYRRLLDADPVVDEDVAAVPGHHKGFHHTIFVLPGGVILALHAHPAFTNQIGDLWFPTLIPTADAASSCDFAAGPGMKWGWGLLLDTRGRPGARRAGSGGWVGMFNTYFWVDPAARITGAFYTQFSPLADPAAGIRRRRAGPLCLPIGNP